MQGHVANRADIKAARGSFSELQFESGFVQTELYALKLIDRCVAQNGSKDHHPNDTFCLRE